jgi:hypothetical protein
MPADRRTQLASIFGGFALLAQLWVLRRFWQQLRRDIDITAWVDRSTLFERMAWLKPGPWQPPWFDRYVAAFLLLCAGMGAWLSIVALLRWYQAWRAGEGDT